MNVPSLHLICTLQTIIQQGNYTSNTTFFWILLLHILPTPLPSSLEHWIATTLTKGWVSPQVIQTIRKQCDEEILQREPLQSILRRYDDVFDENDREKKQEERKDNIYKIDREMSIQSENANEESN